MLTPFRSSRRASPPRVAAALLLIAALPGSGEAAGFQRVAIADTTPDAGQRTIDAGLWYPSDEPPPAEANTPWGQALAIDAPVAGDALPLLVLSHGNGGWMGGHAGLALTLADAGFVVVAPEHPGDSGDEAQDSASRWLSERPHDLSRAIDFVTGEWDAAARVDPTRIGVFGFSAGAYGALALAGARFDPERLVEFCRAHPEEWVCHLGIGADVAAALDDGTLDVERFDHLADERVGAAAIAGPALGFGFDPASLEALAMPLQIWSGELDDAVPFATNTSLLLAHLPSDVDGRVVPKAGHFAFLAPCRAELETARPDLWQRVCVDAPGFDRAAFQQAFHASVTTFFAASLRHAPATATVGVRTIEAAAPHRDAPLGVTLWYPAGPGGVRELVGDNGVFAGAPARRGAPMAPGRYPLVLLSHGGGGNARQLGWIANRLVAAGYLVAAPDHLGSTSGDASALGAVALWRRPADLSAVLTSLLEDELTGSRIDAERVGALGFS